MPPDPPRGSRLRRSRAPPLILPLLRHCSDNLQGVDTYIRPSCSPNRVPLLLDQVLFVSAEAPGLSDQAPLT